MKNLRIEVKWVVAGLLMVLPGLVVFAQPGRVLSTKDGLPQSFISGIEQDEAGFIWIATRNGLARYDGQRFRVFQHHNADTASIASNLIIAIRKFREQIWIEYESGEFDRFDPVSEKVDHVVAGKLIREGNFLRGGWLADAGGALWAIHEEKGLVRYDIDKDKITLYSRDSRFGGDALWGLAEGPGGCLWVLTDRGISSLDRNTGKIVHYVSPVVPDYFAQGQFTKFTAALYHRSNGELMWGDRKHLFFFAPATGKFRVVTMDGKSRRGIISLRPGPDDSEHFERDGTIYRYNDKTGVLLVQPKTVEDENPLQAFLVDRAGLLWLGTNARGIIQLDLTTPFFPSFRIREGFAGDVMSREFGASISSLFDWRPEDSRFSAPGYHLRSAYDRKGRLWVGLKETIAFYDADKKSFTPLPKIPDLTSGSGPGVGLKGLTFTADGDPVVIGYNGNVLRFDSSSLSWKWLLPKGFLSGKLGDALSPRDISMDAGKFWITTEMDGLIIVDLKTLKLQQLKHEGKENALPTNQLLGICPDPSRSDLLWIGSYNGLICLNKKTLGTETFGIGQGFPDQTIYSLLAGPPGHLWFGTNKGLCRFDVLTHQVRVFQTRHGLPEDEFNRFHQLLLPDGRMVFGGTEGWTLFDPLAIKEDVFEPSVALTGLKVNNIDVEQLEGGLLKAPLNAVGELVLPYDQNTIQLSFAGLQFNQPGDLSYRYQLTGYDRDWVEAGSNPLAIYTKIPPGRYVFKVNTSNTTGQWSSYIRSLEIRVRPPWWGTWWAYLLYVLVVAGGIWYWLRSLLIRMELRRSVALRQQEARQLHQLSEMKTRFFTNITHDFRTPLTLILSPLDGLIGEQSGEAQKRKLSSVKRNAEQLLTLINQLLDFSKIEAGALSVAESRGELSAFVENVTRLFSEEAGRKGVALTFQSTVKGDYWFDAPKLERMLGNLVGNALKFTSAGGNVGVLMEEAAGRILMSVTDTGMGIAPEQLPHIFNRYYQAEEVAPEQYQRGSGIGLALVKELATLQNGTIEVESQPGKGSTFRLLLPYQPAGPLAGTEQMQDTTSESEDNPEIEDEEVLILLVEDNDELAGFVAGSLPERYRVIRAANGAEGLRLALEHIPDLIVSDVMMPVMDGFELCRQVKQHEHTRHIPLILLTARASFGSRMEGLELGADDYLSKPFHVRELNLRIYNLLERERRLRRRLQEELSKPKEAGLATYVPKEDPFLGKLFKIVEAHLEEREMGVTALAEELNLSRSQLHRRVRVVSGLAVSELVRNYRLNRAADFLREGLSSSESAYKAGFDSPSYFTKCFREFYGLTPSEFVKAS